PSSFRQKLHGCPGKHGRKTETSQTQIAPLHANIARPRPPANEKCLCNIYPLRCTSHSSTPPFLCLCVLTIGVPSGQLSVETQTDSKKHNNSNNDNVFVRVKEIYLTRTCVFAWSTCVARSVKPER
ncbi:unnamed protein product, partial [Ectocarpus fasciculatus]